MDGFISTMGMGIRGVSYDMSKREGIAISNVVSEAKNKANDVAEFGMQQRLFPKLWARLGNAVLD